MVDSALVAAARAGDHRAKDDLVSASLPLVYTLVRRALVDDPEVDDVVQDVMLRAVRQLPSLREPGSFRSWLTAITVNEIGTRLRRRAAGARRIAPLEEAADLPDPGAEIEGPALLRLELSGQRRQVVRAGYWLDPDDRVLLSLWLLEAAGEMTRAEVATALGAGVAHTAVRIQRMRQQLDLSRALVAAWDARPRCARLEAAASGWDGTPAPLWRKRLGRHTRDCPICARSASRIVPVDRLLPGIMLLPVPIGLTAAVLGKAAAAAPAAVTASSSAVAAATSSASAGAGVKAGLLAQVLQSVMAHPIAASVAAGVLAAGAAVTVTQLPSPAPPPTTAAPIATGPPRVVAPPPTRRATPSSRPATTAAKPSSEGTVSLKAGQPVSLESAQEPGAYVSTDGELGVLTPIRSGSTDLDRRKATFTVVTGLANPTCFSFRTPDDRYLRHSSWRLRLDPDQGTPLFRGDATFCIGDGATDGTVMLEASNYPGWFVHHRGNQMWVDQTDGSQVFRTEASLRLRPALTS
jgi:RNA polymerase sigma factor (sigma-70 family)